MGSCKKLVDTHRYTIHRLCGMAPYPLPGMLQDRKEDLVMDKHLRACRVNIIPRDRGYFSDSESYTPHTEDKTRPQPVTPRPQSVTPYPHSMTPQTQSVTEWMTADKKTQNPVGLRYWNMC